MSRNNKKIKNRIFQYPIDRCYWCKIPLTFEKATVDHIIERAIGGKNHNNVVISCAKCNCKRSYKTASYVNLILQNRLPAYKLILELRKRLYE